MTKQNIKEIREKIGKVKFWYHQVEVAPGVFTPGINDCNSVFNNLELPKDCSGLRVLDLGARDGFFSIMLERRNAAEVIAIDHVSADDTGFPVLKEIFNSNVKYYTDNVYNISEKKYGKFDIILCLGLLYHLRNPLRALEIIRDICRRELYVESHIIDGYFIRKNGKIDSLSNISPELLEIPIMRFYPEDESNRDYTNWWGMNSICLKKMLESTNFTVQFSKVFKDRTIFKCTINNDSKKEYFMNIERGIVPSTKKNH